VMSYILSAHMRLLFNNQRFASRPVPLEALLSYCFDRLREALANATVSCCGKIALDGDRPPRCGTAAAWKQRGREPERTAGSTSSAALGCGCIEA